MNMTVLVTGGAGFIGSHCCLDLLEQGFKVVVVDNLSNSSALSLQRVQHLSGRSLHFLPIDITDRVALDGSALAAGVRQLIFSSLCSIYGNATALPITESAPARPTNPYAAGKLMCERILEDICNSNDDLAVTALRYFNPVGAHPSGLLGEEPRGVPNNVMPYLAQVATGRLAELQVFGADYPTVDGTGVRDYIHVLDIVEGHRLALANQPAPGFRRFNLGTGVGTSVLELVTAFGAACGQTLPYRIVARRAGDVAELVASAAPAESELGWHTTRDVRTMCEDVWNFQRHNPDGYTQESPLSTVTT